MTLTPIQTQILDVLAAASPPGLTASEIAFGIGIRTQPRRLDQLHSAWAGPVTEVVAPLQDLLNQGLILRIPRDDSPGWVYAKA